jgi:hypothetical protein
VVAILLATTNDAVFVVAILLATTNDAVFVVAILLATILSATMSCCSDFVGNYVVNNVVLLPFCVC